MLGTSGLTVLVALGVIAVVLRQPSLVYLTLALLAAHGLSRLYRRHCLTGVHFARRLSLREIAFNETTELELEVVNDKVLPLAWLELNESLPRAIRPHTGQIVERFAPLPPLLRTMFALRPYERVRRRYRIVGSRRGEYGFGPATIRTGDLFGLVSEELVLEESATVVVLPRVIPPGELGLPPVRPLGDLRQHSWLFDDPSRVAGAREHRPGDSLRRIHWPATARLGRLQSRVFEATTSHALLLCLDLQTYPATFNTLEYDPDALELTICAAASLGCWALDQGLAVGLASNGRHRLSAGRVSLPTAGDGAQRARLLRALARLQAVARHGFGEVLTEATHRLARGTTLVAISAVADQRLTDRLAGFRRRGLASVLVYTGRGAPPMGRDGLVVRQVGPPGRWQDLAVLAGGPNEASAIALDDEPLAAAAGGAS